MDDLQKLLENAGLNQPADGERGGYIKDDPSDEFYNANDERLSNEPDAVDEASGDAMEDHIVQSNIEKIGKTLSGTAAMMDKQDRPGVDNPSKGNVSVYINFILEQVIDSLQMQGYEVNWEEKEWD